MKKIGKQVIIFFFFTLNSIAFYAQTNSDQKSYYKWFDAVVGVENLGIYNGVEYYKQYRTLKGSNEFYITTQFVKGTIVYDGQPYYNIDMKYNVYDDELIIKLANQKAFNIIQLIKEKIESFSIDNKHFVTVYNDKNEEFTNIKEGFYELLFQDNYLTFYKKHIKNRSERLDKDFVYYIFKDKKEYFLKYNQKYYRINSKSNFSKIFPEYKKNINAFYKNNKVLRKSDYDMFLNKLSRHIETLIATNTASN